MHFRLDGGGSLLVLGGDHDQSGRRRTGRNNHGLPVDGVLLPELLLAGVGQQHALPLQRPLAVLVDRRGGFPAKHEEHEAEGHRDVDKDD